MDLENESLFPAEVLVNLLVRLERLSEPAHAVRRIEFRQFTVRYSHYSLWAHLTEDRAIKIVPEIASLEDGPVLKEMIERQLRASAKRGP